MDKKVSSLVVIIIIALLLLGFFKMGKGEDTTYWMTGRVVEANDKLVVSGMARSSEIEAERQEERIVGFRITPETRFQKTTTAIYRSDNKFSSEVSEGLFSDIVKNMKIFKIESSGNLFTEDEVTASYINYEIIEIRD